MVKDCEQQWDVIIDSAISERFPKLIKILRFPLQANQHADSKQSRFDSDDCE